MTHRLLPAAPIFLLLTAAFSAWSSPAQLTPAMSEQLNHLLEAAGESMQFNGTVLVANKSEVLFEKSVGFADKDRTVALTPAHRLSPGSIAKEFTTVAIMKLHEQGKLNYQDPISKYLSDLPAWSKDVTVDHIMSHTSGLGRVKYFKGITTADVVKQIKQHGELLYKPGTGYSYGNLNLVLRALVIEKVSGMPFTAYVQKTLFGPAGMTRSFSLTDRANYPEMMVYGDVPTAIAGVTLYTNARDLYKWEQALWDGRYFNNDTLKQAMVKPNLSGQAQRAYFDFGGFALDANGTMNHRDHDGTHPSHHAYLSNYLDKDLIIILMSSDGRKQTLFELEYMIKGMFENEELKTPALWWLTKELKAKDIQVVLAAYKDILSQGTYWSNEETLNALGYQLQGQGKYADAISVTELNLKLYPQSANAHDSHADMLIHGKRYAEAKKVIAKGLALAKAANQTFLINSMQGYLKRIPATK